MASVIVRLHSHDSVAVAHRHFDARRPPARNRHRLPGYHSVGHKVALQAVAAGEAVRKFGQIIGIATVDIAPGDHVQHAQSRHGRTPRPRPRRRNRCSSNRFLSRRRTGDLPGHRACRRPRGNPELHRHPDHGELFGHDRPSGPDRFRAPGPRCFSQYRWRGGAHPRSGVWRHTGRRRHGHPAPAPSPATPVIPTSPPS